MEKDRNQSYLDSYALGSCSPRGLLPSRRGASNRLGQCLVMGSSSLNRCDNWRTLFDLGASNGSD